MRNIRGFTLIELMIVLVIAAVLLLVALPAYQNSVLKSNRAAGKGVMLDVMSKQEQYFINNKTYATTLASIGLPASYYVDNQAQQAIAADAVYKIELVLASTVYTGVQAIPQNRQVKDTQCGTFNITRQGQKSVSGTLSAKPSLCW